MDKDDPTKDKYRGRVHVGEPTGDPTGPLNVAALSSNSDIIGFAGDDSRFETKGWDDQVLEALKTPGFCYGFDGTSPTAWPSAAFISKEIIDVLGYMVPPTLRRGFFDVVWMDLANATKTTRIIPAMFRHDNSPGDPKSKNFIPERQVPPAVIAADEAAYREWRATQFQSDVRKLRHVLYA